MAKKQLPPRSYRRATLSDLDNLLLCAKGLSDELGFVRRVEVEEAIRREEVWMALSLDTPLGFLHYHRRRDGWVTVYLLAVRKEARGLGVGSTLLEILQEWARGMGCQGLRLKCPEDLKSNQFYSRVGWRLIQTEPGRKRALNVWIYPLQSDVSIFA